MNQVYHKSALGVLHSGIEVPDDDSSDMLCVLKHYY